MPFPLLAGLALKAAPIKAALGRIPRWAWIALAVVAILLVGSCVHKRKVKAFGDERYAAGVAYEQARMAEQVKKQVEADRKRSEKLRSKNDETNRRISVDADALRVSGAGKAACLNTASPRPSGRVTPARPADAPLDQVPDGGRAELIALPYADTLDFAEQHDKCLAEAKTWREDKRLQEEAWAKTGE